MRESEAIAAAARIATSSRARGLHGRRGAARRARPHPRQHCRGRPFPPLRPAGERRLEARRGEPVRPRRKGRDAGGALAVAYDCRATMRGTRHFLDGVEAACESYGLPLLGGDTIALPPAHRACSGSPRSAGPGGNVPHRRGGKPGDHLVAGRHARRCRARDSPSLQADPACDGPAGRHLPPAGAAARGRAGAGAACERHDGCVRRPAARRPADGGGERLRPRSSSTRCRCRSAFVAERGQRPRTPGCSRRPAATIMRLLAALPPDSIRQRFLYQTGRRSAASGRSTAGKGSRARPRRRADRAAGDLGFEHRHDEHRGLSAPPVADRP